MPLDDHAGLQILIVDDEENIRFAFHEVLASMGLHCMEAENGAEAVELFARNRIDMVILDYRMPVMDGLETLKELTRINSDVPVLFVTAFGSKDLAMEAIRSGAYDYFTKPFDIEEISIVIRRALEKRQLKQRIQNLSRHMDATLGFDEIIGSTDEMREMYRLIQKISGQDVTALILGESGTGKELVASAIHRHSKRRQGPFVPINCAAIPGTLLESELFGHEKGSFTGASALKVGKFEHAFGGTLFLDEIGDMDMLLQAKMLRVLQEHEFQRVGGNQSIQTDVRIIAATNKDLALEVTKGNFREDLYFRLNVIAIFVPPLRRRISDIPLLIDHFVKKANQQYSKSISGFSMQVMEKLMQHHWPGNIRELENVITRAIILSHGPQITISDLPPPFNQNGDCVEAPEGDSLTPYDLIKNADSNSPGIQRLMDRIDLGTPLQEALELEVDQLEKEVITSALEKNRWKRGQTALFLGISRRNLLRKMQKLGIE